MTIVETVVVFVLIPLAVYCLVALMTMRPKATRIRRYRPGQPWDYPAVWWTANPGGLTGTPHAADSTAGRGEATNDLATAAGGARGNW